MSYVLPCVDIIDIVPFVEQRCVKWDGTHYRYHEHYQHTLLHVLYPRNKYTTGTPYTTRW